jgi:hypothetical protein
MAKYRYVRNVKPSWDRTDKFVSIASDGSEVTVTMGEIVDLDPKDAKGLSEYFVLDIIKDESAPVVVNHKSTKTVGFNESLEGGE